MDTLHALHYNILYATGNLFGLGNYASIFAISPDLADQYADLVNNNGTDVIDPLYPSKTVFEFNNAPNSMLGQINAALVSIHTWQSSVISESEAEELNATLNLFGMKYLPWNAYALKDSTGSYVYMHGWSDSNTDITHIESANNVKMFNPLRREILMRKAQSVAILGAVGLTAYYGGKYLYKRINQ